MTNSVEITEIDGKEFYILKASYFKNEREAELNGYYWDDEIDMYTKEITNNNTTAF